VTVSHQSSGKPPNSVYGNDPEYLNDLITQLLRSEDESFDKYSNSVPAGVKSFFHRMDKDLKGSLRRHDVQDEFCRAIRHNKVPVPEPQLIGLVSLGDKTHSGRIDLETFQDLVLELLTLVDGVAEKALQQSTKELIACGKDEYKKKPS
jgi:hypothetical protein